MIENLNEYPTTYSITLHDVLEVEPALLTNIFTFDGNNTRATKFIKVFLGMYDIYEIGAETIELFKNWLQDTYDEYIDYYIEMLDAYEIKINMLDGVVSDDLETYIDLPNKSTDKEYATNKTKRHSTGNVNVIDLKREYLNLIKNLYRDFAKDFRACFAIIY